MEEIKRRGKMFELNDLEIEIYGFSIPLPKENEQRYNELVEKAKNPKQENFISSKKEIRWMDDRI